MAWRRLTKEQCDIRTETHGRGRLYYPRRGYGQISQRYYEIDQWLSSIPHLLTLGRQGLFAHGNTHHTLAMAYAAVDGLDKEGRFDHAKWKQYRKTFESYVVVD
jgi:hypothetical protein